MHVAMRIHAADVLLVHKAQMIRIHPKTVLSIRPLRTALLPPAEILRCRRSTLLSIESWYLGVGTDLQEPSKQKTRQYQMYFVPAL
jgi:hypothetical protein